MFDSLENITRAQSSMVQFLYFFAQIRRFCVWASVKRGFFWASLAAKWASLRRLLTIWGEIAIPCCSHRLLLSPFDDFLRSWRVIRIKWRSVLGFVDRFRPVLQLRDEMVLEDFLILFHDTFDDVETSCYHFCGMFHRSSDTITIEFFALHGDAPWLQMCFHRWNKPNNNDTSYVYLNNLLRKYWFPEF